MPSAAVARREIETHSAEETIARGREIGAELKPPVLVLLSGDLGAGKTTLSKGIAAGAGAAREDDVTSPTFTLVHKYEGKTRVYHVDLIGSAICTIWRRWGWKTFSARTRS